MSFLRERCPHHTGSTALSPNPGQAFLTLSPLQISSLAVISGRLWVGTGGGALFSIPLSISKDSLWLGAQVPLHSEPYPV